MVGNFGSAAKAERASGAESASMVDRMQATCAVQTMGKEYPISSPTAQNSLKAESYLTIDFECFSKSG